MEHGPGHDPSEPLPPPVTLEGIGTVSFRFLRPDDRNLLLDFFRSHSEETVRQRYFTPLREIPGPQLERLLDVDGRANAAVIAVRTRNGREEILALARYLREADGASAEIALTVHDCCQGRGLGTRLLRVLVALGRKAGIAAFHAVYLAENKAMARIFQRLAPEARPVHEDGVFRIRFPAPLETA